MGQKGYQNLNFHVLYILFHSGQLKIYHLTHYRNPFRRGLPCAQEVGLTFYTQVFIVIKMVTIAIGLSLIVTYFLLKLEGRLCWRKYNLKKECSLH